LIASGTIAPNASQRATLQGRSIRIPPRGPFVSYANPTPSRAIRTQFSCDWRRHRRQPPSVLRSFSADIESSRVALGPDLAPLMFHGLLYFGQTPNSSIFLARQGWSNI